MTLDAALFSSPACGAVAGAALRVWAVLLPQGALDADEAVVGLMTHKILHGTLPVFFPGQGYGGTQEAFLAAPFVAAFGLYAWTIRIVVVLLWAAAAVLVWRIGLRVLDERRAVIAAVLFESGPPTSTGSRRARMASTAPSSFSGWPSCCSSCASPSA